MATVAYWFHPLLLGITTHLLVWFSEKLYAKSKVSLTIYFFILNTGYWRSGAEMVIVSVWFGLFYDGGWQATQ